MVSRLRPLDVKVDFHDRPYKLGETIDLTVELTPRGDVEVREGRVDLECELSYTEVTTVMVSPRSAGGRGGAFGVPVPMVPKQVSEEHKETDVRGSVVFVNDTRLRSGTASTYRAKLEIQPEVPLNVAGSARRGRADMKWGLVTTVDVAQARDIATRQPIQVLVRSGRREGDRSRSERLTPEQRRENARKAAQARWAKARVTGNPSG